MSIAALALIGVAIGLNNFAVSLALGALGQEPRRWRIASVFFVFEFTIPLVGLAIGSVVADTLAGAGRWTGAGLLVFLGLIALKPSGRGGPDRERLARAVTSWKGLAGLSAGLSIDNLVIGFALGLDGAEPLLVATVIAVSSTLFALLGLRLGRFGSEVAERGAQIIAGGLLVLLGTAVAAGVVT